jgi:hypothetical protein
MAHPLVICLAGAGSRSGRPMDLFRSIVTYLKVAGAYSPDDFVEGSYRIAENGRPLPYDVLDSTASLADVTSNVARCLQWFRRTTVRPLYLLGWSLGGVALFDALAGLSDFDPSWAKAAPALVTLASPLLGSDLDGIDALGAVAAGHVGADLTRRAADETQKRRVRQDAARLRAAGVRLVTLAAEDDAVVTPEDSLLPANGPDPAAFVLRPRRQVGGTYLENVLGHGALPHDPACWRHVLTALGPAE